MVERDRMIKLNGASVRIIPGRGMAIFYAFFFLLFILTFSQAFVRDTGSVTVNGQEVYGDERQRVRVMMRLFLIIPAGYLIWYGRRLLPRSPLDFIEIGPQGLTVGGLFGRRHRRWDEISGFSVGNIPLTNPPTIWIKAESQRPLRFFMSGYVRYKFFSRAKPRVQAIADWLDLVRRTYAFGDGTMPSPPEELGGKIIPLAGDKMRSSVIERR
jgi:hypothetical protein